MDNSTKNVVDYIIKLSTIANMQGVFVINKKDKTFIGVDIRFEPPLDLSKFPSIERAMEILKK